MNSGGGSAEESRRTGKGMNGSETRRASNSGQVGGAKKVAITSKMKDLIHREITRRLRWYLPLVSAWVLKQERFILETGVPLTDPQKSDARLAGVLQPDQVRLLSIEQIPLPEYADSHWITSADKEMAEVMKLSAPPAAGLALRYGIYIRSDHWGQREPVVHELAHTAQYERLGSVPAFLECYLHECLAIGCTAAPMEQEAIAVARRICRASGL